MGNLARRPSAKFSLTPLSTQLTHSHFIPYPPFLPYCLTIGGGCDFRSALEVAAAKEVPAFAADLVLPLLLATVWST